MQYVLKVNIQNQNLNLFQHSVLPFLWSCHACLLKHSFLVMLPQASHFLVAGLGSITILIKKYVIILVVTVTVIMVAKQRQVTDIYRISTNSFRGNYFFLKVENAEIFIQFHHISNFLFHKLNSCRGNYSREETIQGNTVCRITQRDLDLSE